MLLLSLFDSKLLRKKYCIYFTVVIVLLSWPFTAALFAKEMTHYIKGLGSPLREQPKISSKVLTKLSRGTKFFQKRQKGYGRKLRLEKIRDG